MLLASDNSCNKWRMNRRLVDLALGGVQSRWCHPVLLNVGTNKEDKVLFASGSSFPDFRQNFFYTNQNRTAALYPEPEDLERYIQSQIYSVKCNEMIGVLYRWPERDM
ncbi:Malic enzyme [Dirofilaria immitis]|nr:Malic enzyme [Dirofilaria immitis]